MSLKNRIREYFHTDYRPGERLLVQKIDFFILTFCCVSYLVNYVCAPWGIEASCMLIQPNSWTGTISPMPTSRECEKTSTLWGISTMRFLSASRSGKHIRQCCSNIVI